MVIAIGVASLIARTPGGTLREFRRQVGKFVEELCA